MCVSVYRGCERTSGRFDVYPCCHASCLTGSRSADPTLSGCVRIQWAPDGLSDLLRLRAAALWLFNIDLTVCLKLDLILVRVVNGGAAVDAEFLSSVRFH